MGDGLNDVSYSPGHSKGSFSVASDHGSDRSMNDSGWSFYNYVGGGTTGMVFPTSIQNPNKAICTVNAKTSKVQEFQIILSFCYIVYTYSSIKLISFIIF